MTYSVHAETNKVLVVYRPPFNLFRFVFFPLWLAVWAAIIIGSRLGEPGWVRIVVLIFFGSITLGAGYGWLFDLAGREELEFTPDALTNRRMLFGMSRTRTFEAGKITDPHFVERRRRGMSGSTPSGIGFSYGGKAIKLCEHVSQPTAKGIVSTIVQRVPQHAEIWKHYVEGLPEADGYINLDLK